MKWDPQVGDRVHVNKFRTLDAFDGVIVEVIGKDRFNVRDGKGYCWFRTTAECQLITKAEAAE